MNSPLPYLYLFRERLPDAAADEEDAVYSPEQLASVLPDGTLAWRALTSKHPTNVYSPGHRIPAGWTPSGKHRPARIVPGKMDKRVGH